MISARPPNVFLDGKHGVKRLIPDYREQEQAYFQKTGIFPIMHIVVMRRDAYEANRWIARNLMEAFEQAKRACLPELYQGQTSFLPTAWGNDHVEETNRLLFPDGDPWPYGIEKNRKTLEPFLAFCHEQGVTKAQACGRGAVPQGSRRGVEDLAATPTPDSNPGMTSETPRQEAVWSTREFDIEPPTPPGRHGRVAASQGRPTMHAWDPKRSMHQIDRSAPARLTHSVHSNPQA